MRSHSVLVSCAILGSLLISCQAAPLSQVLVLLDSPSHQKTHSKFFEDLERRSYSLEFKEIDDRGLRLQEWDEWLYDTLIIIGSSKPLGGAVDVPLITQFVDSGRNLILFVDGNVSDEMRELAQECGIDIDLPEGFVLDHFKNEAGDPTSVIAGDFLKYSSIIGANDISGELYYQGKALSVSPESETAFLAAWGSPTSYSASLSRPISAPFLAGTSTGLIALTQTRCNSRVAVFGSTNVCSDVLYMKKGAANGALCNALSRWTFQERGVLQAAGFVHHKVSESQSRTTYRIKDVVTVSLDISECEKVQGQSLCHPYSADDVQIELVMLSPYIRKTLKHSSNGTFSTNMMLPDVYGVFKWIVDYRRPGYTTLSLSEQIPITPFRHNEYERFVPQAFPYYASVMSMMAGFFILGLFFLNTKQ